MWNLQSGKFSLVEYGTLGLEMWNPPEGIWNTGIQVLSTKNLESNNWNVNPQRGIQNPRLLWITLHGVK